MKTRGATSEAEENQRNQRQFLGKINKLTDKPLVRWTTNKIEKIQETKSGKAREDVAAPTLQK